MQTQTLGYAEATMNELGTLLQNDSQYSEDLTHNVSNCSIRRGGVISGTTSFGIPDQFLS